MLHIDQSFKCEYSSSNFNFILSFLLLISRNLCSRFSKTFESNNSNFPAYAVSIATSCTSHANEQMSNKSSNAMQTEWEKRFPDLAAPTHSNVRTAFWPTIRTPFKRLVPNRATHYIYIMVVIIWQC